MSKRFPVIALTGSSGAGTSSVMDIFKKIFAIENIKVQTLCGDAMHRYERKIMDAHLNEGKTNYLSHFNPKANLLKELAETFETFRKSGQCKVRKYIHTEAEAEQCGYPAGTMTPWQDSIAGAEVLLYEGLHGGYVGEDADVAAHVDLLIGIVPTVNLEWVQKLNRDPKVRGYSKETVTNIILKRMPDYVHYICPQFSRTHVNFQRVPIVDTSNPFEISEIPNAEESMVVIRFAKPREIDFPYLLSMLHDSMMTRPDTIVIPGGKLSLAFQLIFTPMILRLMH